MKAKASITYATDHPPIKLHDEQLSQRRAGLVVAMGEWPLYCRPNSGFDAIAGGFRQVGRHWCDAPIKFQEGGSRPVFPASVLHGTVTPSHLRRRRRGQGRTRAFLAWLAMAGMKEAGGRARGRRQGPRVAGAAA